MKLSWNLGLIKNTFGIVRLLPEKDSMPTLEKWLAAKGNLTDLEEKELEFLRQKLMKNVDNWDEEALKMKFIAFILRMCNYLYEDGEYQSYFDKQISATVKEYLLTSKPDMMLAKGEEDEMTTPYFCFHEYKKSKPEKDPRAQLLMDMFIAQTLNANDKSIYGCYVVGGFWYFAVLEQQNFMISHAYDATQKAQLQQIIFILKDFWDILKNELRN